MSARKAYISSLGTTGLLIAAALAMLIVVGALVAFDRWPSQAVAEAESVPVTRDGVNASHQSGESRAFARSGPSVRTSAISEKRSAAVLRRAAARAGKVDAAAAPAPAAPAVHEPIVSDLPAPDSAPSTPAPAAPAPAAQQQAPEPASAPAPTPPEATLPVITPGELTPTTEHTLDDATAGLGDTVSALSPALGHTIRGTGTTATGTIHVLLGGK
jgi:hypothetical protein